MPNYIFSIIPLIGILTAKWIDISIHQGKSLWRTFFYTQNFVVFTLWASVFSLSIYLFPKPDGLLWIIIFFGILASIFIYAKVENPSARLITPSVIVFSCLTFLMNIHVFPYIFSFQAPPRAARYYSERRQETDKLFNYKYGQYELFFYSTPQAKQIMSENELKEIAGKKGNWIFTDEEGFNEVKKLSLSTDTLIQYRHLYLNKGGKFINPKTRDTVLQPMYLIKY